MPDSLPIDPLLPEIVAAVRAHPVVVVEAPPGAGKTTRVPAALLTAGVAGERQVVVLEPRRLAARLAARYLASERGERVGESVGYQVRFERQVGPRTRLRFVTEALLTRQLLAAPLLPDVGVVVLDEFHERQLWLDVGLTLLRRLQERRPDLRLVLMSATIDGAAVAAAIPGAVCLRATGRAYPVEVRFAAGPDPRPLAQQVAAAVSRLTAAGTDGDLLVFVPGVAEIRRCLAACARLAQARDLALMPLYGELPPAEQDRALRPGPRRRVIVSTNVAETSVTIEGITAVVDSGLARIPGYDPWSGLPTLRVRPISRASAAQRAGRAGRLAPGLCERLYTRGDHDTRREQDPPEICRADLSELTLLLHGLGHRAPAELPWLDPPAAAAWEAAAELLARLGATRAGALTPLGRELAALPLHPRLGRLVLATRDVGTSVTGCAVAALLGERDLRRVRQRARQVGGSDLDELLHLLDEAEAEGFAEAALERRGIAAGAARRVARVRDQLVRQVAGARHPAVDPERGLQRAVLLAFPDRVARRREADGAEVVLSGGGSAMLADTSVVQGDRYLVAVEAEVDGARGQPIVRLASAIEPDWLVELFPNDVVAEEVLEWDDHHARVEQVSRLRYGALLLDESRAAPHDLEAAAALLRERAFGAGAAAFCPPDALGALVRRAELAAELTGASLPAGGVEAWSGAALAELCTGRRAFAEIDGDELLATIRARLGPIGARLDELAPEQVTLAGGRRLRVHYPAGQPPWVESYLQDFFGSAVGPSLAGGRLPLTLHLLAPNRRPVQVTRDLASFWRNHYPALRRELGRRYPRHDWPEDPARARPPPPHGRRRR